MGDDFILNFMSTRKMSIIFTAEVSRSKPWLEPNESLNEVLIKIGNRYLRSRIIIKLREALFLLVCNMELS